MGGGGGGLGGCGWVWVGVGRCGWVWVCLCWSSKGVGGMGSFTRLPGFMKMPRQLRQVENECTKSVSSIKRIAVGGHLGVRTQHPLSCIHFCSEGPAQCAHGEKQGLYVRGIYPSRACAKGGILEVGQVSLQFPFTRHCTGHRGLPVSKVGWMPAQYYNPVNSHSVWLIYLRY